MDTWWIDEPYLLGSRNPTDAELEELQGNGFTVLLSLLRADEQAAAYTATNAEALGYNLINIPVKDYSPPTVEQLQQFIRLVEDLHPQNKMIIHCQGGIGRTGTFAAAYWITRGMTAHDAIHHVRKVRPHAVETAEQEAILTEFERINDSSVPTIN